MFSFVDQNDYHMTYSEDEIKNNVGVQFKGWKVGVGWGNTNGGSTYGFSSESFQWITFYGGDATLALTDRWEQWVNSTGYAPAQITKVLNPIQNLAIDPTIQSNIALAVGE